MKDPRQYVWDGSAISHLVRDRVPTQGPARHTQPTTIVTWCGYDPHQSGITWEQGEPAPRPVCEACRAAKDGPSRKEDQQGG